MNVAFNTAVTGMLAAQSQVATAGSQMVANSAKGQDIIQAAVAIKRAEATHAAAAAVARTASDMTDTLLDITV
ncbi:MAG: hypothetical protein CMH94_09360 [Oceanicaulis sp.]|uniref:Flagellar basal-body/hook protein C-terminal domain-containing protein n=1 Tax=Maricaulis virginensis TaxID=144022 RepID=A0A9W6MPC2_9PROT|nr:hypothetical protein [Maricaulis virginensis]MBI75793.1 hypothetical protein [Oceanicaulis sp.]MED5549182.1 hypothetical protein [Pseudomonadota bacterium]GLK53038.1 hypothetical protein GCM10017621_25460 [Maricaulis virginensis]|tara:strand:+ start:239 stop:457 length:219 start_codon:yes stop_codon:yes gene_type:complete